jgi:4-amino-4-deoxy-L-arabinose transferase-like glycosyltransferase
MGTTLHAIPAASPTGTQHSQRQTLWHLWTILGLWLAIFGTSLIGPPLLDDADATHAQAAQAMLHTGDWVTLHVDGIRYLEKAPLPYWIAAASMRLFGENAFAVHLPLALTVLGLALLGYAWSRRAFGQRAAIYTAIFVLTSTGVFLFTRIFIPDALLSLLLAAALFCFLRAMEEPTSPRFAYALWLALALAVLTKGLVALVFFFGAALAYLLWTRQLPLWQRLRPATGLLLFFAIAAPWHILAGLRNTGGAGGHGFFWFYFINEHILRYLGRREPRDYNKLPTLLYWTLHLVWLFPWSLFAPAALLANRKDSISRTPRTFAQRSILLLSLFSVIALLFFSFSTNQEYYTFPVYLPLLMLIAAGIANASTQDRNIAFSYAALTFVSLIAAAVLAYGLWTARHLAFVPDIGSVLAHRSVAGYTLSMSHLFDLTGASFAALRLPATLAALTLALGPAIAWILHRRRPQTAILTVTATSAIFLIAAHLALLRFAPMLSSQSFAATITSLERTHAISANTDVLILGDQSFGSSIPFYLDHPVKLVDGRSTSMLFGSTFPDAPPIFLTREELNSQWGQGKRKLLFVPLEQRNDADHLLDSRAILLQEISGKALYTDRPLDRTP